MVVNPYRNSGIRTPYTQGSAMVGGKSAACACIPTRWLILVFVVSITVISYVFHIHHGLTLEPKHEELSSNLRGDQAHYRKPRIGSHLTTDHFLKPPHAPREEISHLQHINEDKATVPPSLKPSPSPTSEKPTQGPTPPPRGWPTILPTPLPTVAPTLLPSIVPSIVPFIVPSAVPTIVPSSLKATEQASQTTAITTTDPPVMATISTFDKVNAVQAVGSNVAIEFVAPPELQTTNLEAPVINHNQPPKFTSAEETSSVSKQVNVMPLELVEGEIPIIRPLSLPQAEQQPEHVLTPPKEVTAAEPQLSIAPPAVVDAASDLFVPASIDVAEQQQAQPDGEQMISVEEAAAEVKRTDLTGGNEPIEQQQRSRFDLPASVNAVYPGRPSVKGTSSSGNSTSPDGSKSKVDYCQGHIDPFEDQSIENFTPPPSASFDKVVEWKSTVKDTLKGIGKLQIGGEKLRKIMEQEVDKLKILRFKLFCEYAT